MNSRSDIAKEKISELENLAVGTIQNEIGGCGNYRINRALVNYGTTLNSDICV